MQFRKDALVNNNYYHIFNRSIAQYEIFNNAEDFSRMVNILDLYRYEDFTHKYSGFHELSLANQEALIESLHQSDNKIVEIAAYCLMPTHFHLLLKQLVKDGITKYMSKVLNSYSRYFNVKYRRTGPLWSGRFKNVLVSKDDQFLHLTRYIHLNPTSAGLVTNPKEWVFSSYREYIEKDFKDNICNYSDILNQSSKEYKKFVLDRKSYQKELSIIKNLLIDNYTG